MLSSESYVYDSAGNLTSKVVDGTTTTYGYDVIDQLTSESRSGYAAAYTYDANGNRTSKTLNGSTDAYTVDSGDKLTSIALGGGGTKAYAYDAAGRTTSVTTSAGTTALVYDYEGRITGVTYPNLSTSSFAYNGLDTRVSKSNGSATAVYKRDGVEVVDPVLADGSANYTPGISERRLSHSSFLHADIAGSATLLTDAGQSVTDTRTFDAFGVLVSSTGGSHSPFGFVALHGYQRDSESDLYLLGHRYYDSSTGRFLTRDPAQVGRNWYSYASSNPTTKVDPSGLEGNPLSNLSAGWGDTLTFGGTKIIRRFVGEYLGIGDANESVDYDSGCYTAGEVAGTLHSTLIGAAGGWKAAGQRTFGKEFSHWIPDRFLRNFKLRFVRETFGKSKFNGNFVNKLRHALHDPNRYVKSMTKADKLHPILQQIDRLPRVYIGGFAGLGAASAHHVFGTEKS